MRQVGRVNPDGKVFWIHTDIVPEDVADLDPDNLARNNYFVVLLEPTTDIWKDK